MEIFMKTILDWKKYEETAINAIAEGCVLLENKNNVLPLADGTRVSVFGRIQKHYYKSGTGSGGKVNVSKVYSIIDGIKETESLQLNENLEKIYDEWEEKNPYDEGLGWGQERWSQDEMPLTEKIVSEAASFSDVAIAIIGRTAGEDKDNSNTEGSYLLTCEEKNMLKKIRAGFKKLVVLLNVGNIIDMSFVDEFAPDAVMYVWQGGMMGGLGTVKVLTGEIPPSGKLTDTIAKKISDYPSDKNFGDTAENIYAEDIFVGYRYFETFAKDKVVYPFGFGLSYSKFSFDIKSADVDEKKQIVSISVDVKNIGNAKSKETMQIYVKAPNGKLGKAERVLVDFEKTNLLAPGETQRLGFAIPFERFASYDDSGTTGNKSCFVLEEGNYSVFAGTDVRSAKAILNFCLEKTIVTKKCEEAFAPLKDFERFHNADGKLVTEKTPKRTISMVQRRNENIPDEIRQTESFGIKLNDVLEKKSTMRDFVAQFSDEDLSCIIRGEGMSSSLVTAGTASAYGGVSKKLRETFGIPAVCCDDGPSGMRLDCGMKAFALPNGTLLASTFNKNLVADLYTLTGYEMISNKVDNLLGPGMNIHRHPLNGRNFEYFSEDPYLTGTIGTAMICGLKKAGVTGTIKHFCGNNQEISRHRQDSIISERALREIYLKGFEIAVKSGFSDSVMTTYGKVNGHYTAGCYDLCTTILRNDWGFNGIVMTDWWANIIEENGVRSKNDFAAMVRAQNDLYMVCPNGEKNESGDNTLDALSENKVARSELQRSAINICTNAMHSEAMRRLNGTETEVEIINRPKDADDVNLEDVEFKIIEGDTDFDLTYQETKAGSNYILAWDVRKLGTYEITLTGSSDLGELAQLPCTLLYQGIPVASFTFHGTDGKDMEIKRTMIIPHRFCIGRLQCFANGLKLKSLRIKYLNDNTNIGFPS